MKVCKFNVNDNYDLNAYVPGFIDIIDLLTETYGTSATYDNVCTHNMCPLLVS